MKIPQNLFIKGLQDQLKIELGELIDVLGRGGFNVSRFLNNGDGKTVTYSWRRLNVSVLVMGLLYLYPWIHVHVLYA